MKYKPKYARGQILVAFASTVDRNFAREFGKKLRYKLSDEEIH